MHPERVKVFIECLAWLTFAGLLYYFSLGFRTGGLGGGYRLGPEFWVDLVISLIVIATFANLGIRLLATRGAKGEQTAPGDPADGSALDVAKVMKLGAMFVMPLAFVWLITRIGFYLTLPLFVIGVLLALGERRSLPIAGITVGVCAALFLFFTTLLYVPLPLGNVEFFYEINVAIRVLLR